LLIFIKSTLAVAGVPWRFLAAFKAHSHGNGRVARFKKACISGPGLIMSLKHRQGPPRERQRPPSHFKKGTIPAFKYPKIQKGSF
jgi:hypothetical protein